MALHFSFYIPSIDEGTAISRILGGRAKAGIYHEVLKVTNALIVQENLPTQASERVTYGREEVALMQDALIQDIAIAKDWKQCMSTLIVLALGFIAGLRAGSICSSDPKDSERGGMDSEDLKFQRSFNTKVNSFATLVNVRHLKGYILPTDRRFVDLTLALIKYVQNLHLDPSVYLLPYLMTTGRLREAGPGGKVIEIMEQLANTKASVLEGFGGPLYVYHGHLQISLESLCTDRYQESREREVLATRKAHRSEPHP
ncbi:unnamed protein product [Sympodiomycopsis kandeliae]